MVRIFIRYSSISLLLIMVSWLCSCSDEDDESTELTGNWVRLSYFDGVARYDAVGFSIGDKGYIGTGYDGSDRLNDFWEYDPERNAWSQKADFPGAQRNSAIGFGLAGKGYIGTGYDGEHKLNDFWEYTPETNSWIRKADFGGSARYGALSMTIGNKGYVGTGYDGNYLKDLWEYDPSADAWAIITFSGNKRRDAVGFSVNGKGYICTGINNGSYVTDMWEYDPETDTWTQKRNITDASDESYDDDYTSITGIQKVAFTIGGFAYLTTGGESTTSQAVWKYDPVADLWEEKTSLEGSARTEAVCFAIGTRGYVATGHSSSYNFDDIWAFDPDSTENEDD
jgi:N-acetylneuraminic acid mutarotase